MTRIAAALAIVSLLATALVAHAATLSVDAGILQTQQITIDIDLPDPPPDGHTITARIHKYNSGNDPAHIDTVTDPDWTWTIPDGHWYSISWSQASKLADCEDLGYPAGPGEVLLDTSGSHGPLQATDDVDYVACYQTGLGTNSFTLQQHGLEAP